MSYVIGFFKMLCLSFVTITLCAVFLGAFFSWMVTSPKASQAKRDECSDHIFECVRVAQWTLLAAGVTGLLWFGSCGLYYLFWV